MTKKKKHHTAGRRVEPSNRALLDAFTERDLDVWATQSVDLQSYAEDIRPWALCHYHQREPERFASGERRMIGFNPSLRVDGELPSCLQ